MSSNLVEIRSAPPVPRPVQDGIPSLRAQRDRIMLAVREYVAGHALTPPLTFNELHDRSGEILTAAGEDLGYRNWAMVLLNNESWRETMRSIPHNRRLLLLPQCFKDFRNCRAPLDEMGLLCQECGLCAIGTLKQKAEALGYVVVVSEGTPMVLALVQSGQVDAFVGASCMSVLEKVFPIMSLMGVPAVAIPLLCAGCKETGTDLDWLEEAIDWPDAGGNGRGTDGGQRPAVTPR